MGVIQNGKKKNYGPELPSWAFGTWNNEIILNLGKPRLIIPALKIHIPAQNHLCSVLQSNGN
jgi:hypothetical protein